MSPALTGGFSTTAPPGKPITHFFEKSFLNSKWKSKFSGTNYFTAINKGLYYMLTNIKIYTYTSNANTIFWCFYHFSFGFLRRCSNLPVSFSRLQLLSSWLQCTFQCCIQIGTHTCRYNANSYGELLFTVLAGSPNLEIDFSSYFLLSDNYSSTIVRKNSTEKRGDEGEL